MQVPMQLAPQSADPNPGATCSLPPGSYLTLPRFLVPDLEYVVYHSLCIHVPPWSCGRAAYGILCKCVSWKEKTNRLNEVS